MRIISPSLSSGTGNSTPLSSRSPLPGRSKSPFHQSNKEKEYRWVEHDSRGPPLTSRSPSPGRSKSTFHQPNKEKETRWGDRDFRGPPLTSRCHLQALPHQDPWSRQSNKDKENHSRDDRHSYPRVPRPEDRHVQILKLKKKQLLNLYLGLRTSSSPNAPIQIYLKVVKDSDQRYLEVIFILLIIFKIMCKYVLKKQVERSIYRYSQDPW